MLNRMEPSNRHAAGPRDSIAIIGEPIVDVTNNPSPGRKSRGVRVVPAEVQIPDPAEAPQSEHEAAGFSRPDATWAGQPAGESSAAQYDNEIQDDFIDPGRGGSSGGNVLVTEARNVIPIGQQPRPRGPPAKSRLPRDLPFMLNHPSTLEAMKNLGLRKEDLFLPGDADLDPYSREPALRDLVRERMMEQVNRLVGEIADEIKRLAGIPPVTPPKPVPKADVVDARQKREAERILLKCLREERAEQEQQAAEKLAKEDLDKKECARQQHLEDIQKPFRKKYIDIQLRRRERELNMLRNARAQEVKNERQQKEREDEEAKAQRDRIAQRRRICELKRQNLEFAAGRSRMRLLRKPEERCEFMQHYAEKYQVDLQELQGRALQDPFA
jgi:hypothetical protein